MRYGAWILLLAVIEGLVPAGAVAAQLSGTVVSVASGNSLTLQTGREKIQVRLAEIYAPERRQPFGMRSRISLAELCHGKNAEIRNVRRDRDGRVSGHVICNGIYANAEQARRGLAWVYERDARPDSLHLIADTARIGRRGLWADQAPVPPWEWRNSSHGATTATLH